MSVPTGVPANSPCGRHGEGAARRTSTARRRSSKWPSAQRRSCEQSSARRQSSKRLFAGRQSPKQLSAQRRSSEQSSARGQSSEWSSARRQSSWWSSAWRQSSVRSSAWRRSSQQSSGRWTACLSRDAGECGVSEEGRAVLKGVIPNWRACPSLVPGRRCYRPSVGAIFRRRVGCCSDARKVDERLTI